MSRIISKRRKRSEFLNIIDKKKQSVAKIKIGTNSRGRDKTPNEYKPSKIPSMPATIAFKKFEPPKSGRIILCIDMNTIRIVSIQKESITTFFQMR
jgi:hypothetical protein